MDTTELAEAKRRLGIAVAQLFNEFESKTGLQVIGLKIKRLPDEQWIESVTVKIDVPDLAT